MTKLIRAHFGGVKIPMAWCEKCGDYAFVIDGKIQCCDYKVELKSDRKIVNVQFSQGTGRRRAPSDAEKEAILKRQNYLCVYCGVDLDTTIVHFDHFIPFSYTFTEYHDDNFVASCSECNLIKHNSIYETIGEAGNDIRKQKKQKEKGRRAQKLPRMRR